MTTIADVISQAMIYIDDVRLNEELAVNHALFYRRMSSYIDAALPLLSRPPELYKFVINGFLSPEFTDYKWTSTQSSTSSSVEVPTEAIGYDLCSIVQYSEDGTYTTPYEDATYDSETGIITFPIQIRQGIEYDINFYTDGGFDPELTPAIKRLMALAVAVIWNERFTNNWLNLQPKIKDASFSTVNESNYMDKLTIRNEEMRQAFNDELRKYEQDNAFENLVPKAYRYRSLR